MKRASIILSLLIMFAFVFTACGGGDSDDSSSSSLTCGEHTHQENNACVADSNWAIITSASKAAMDKYWVASSCANNKVALFSDGTARQQCPGNIYSTGCSGNVEYDVTWTPNGTSGIIFYSTDSTFSSSHCFSALSNIDGSTTSGSFTASGTMVHGTGNYSFGLSGGSF